MSLPQESDKKVYQSLTLFEDVVYSMQFEFEFGGLSVVIHSPVNSWDLMSTRYTYVPLRPYLNGRSRENDSHSKFLAPMLESCEHMIGRRLPN